MSKTPNEHKPAIDPSLTAIADLYGGILLDAYGVFWGGGVGILPGSQEAMEALVQARKIVGILSNSSQLASKEKEKLKRHGLIEGEHYHFLLTSGEIARNIFTQENLPFNISKKKYWIYGKGHSKYPATPQVFNDTAFTEASNIEDADFIYIGIPHVNGEDVENPELFRKEVKKLSETELPMVCANPDRFAHEGNPPRAVVRQGTIAALYQDLGGVVFAIGKPNQEVFMAAKEHFNDLELREIVMVGDTPETDVRGAKNYGMRTALITQTGIFAERIKRLGLEKSISDLPLSDRPDYFIKRLSL